MAARVPPAALLRALTGLAGGERQIRKRAREIGTYLGVEHVFLLSSGRAALALTFKALRSLAPERDEVLLPAYTCYSVPAAVMKAGLRPSLCDIDLATLDYDAALLEEAVTPRTLCVVTGNLLGVPSDVAAVREVCRKTGAYLVQDAAQAFGGSWQRGRFGVSGDVVILSFGRGKNVTCGSGGAAVTASRQIAEALGREYASAGRGSLGGGIADFARLVALAVFVHPSLYWLLNLLPFLGLGKTIYREDFPVRRLSGVCAAALIGWERRLAESNRAREAHAGALMSRLPVSRRPGVPLLRVPVFAGSREARNRLQDFSTLQGLGISTLYPAPIHEVPEVRRRFLGKRYPAAATAAETLFCLPTHEFLSEADLQALCAAVSQCTVRRDAAIPAPAGRA